MLARMTKADTQTVVTANFIIERANIMELLRERRRGFDHAGFEAASDLTGQPGLALRAAADHDRVGTRHFKRGHRLLERCDIAVDDERNTNRALDRAHSAPIGVALVELAARAAMHRNQPHARGLCAVCQLRRVEGVIIPTE